MSLERGEIEDKVRDGMVRQLRQNLSRCRRVILDEKFDLRTRERWTQLYNNTSQILNQILKDRQLRDMEKRLQIIEQYRGVRKNTEQVTKTTTESETTKPENKDSSNPQ